MGGQVKGNLAVRGPGPPHVTHKRRSNDSLETTIPENARPNRLLDLDSHPSVELLKSIFAHETALFFFFTKSGCSSQNVLTRNF